MAAVEVIDLTLSPPRSPNAVETQDETKKTRRSGTEHYAGKLGKKKGNNNEGFNEKPNLNRNSSRNKRKREEGIDNIGSNKRRRSSSSSLPFFTLDANPSKIDLAVIVPTQTDVPTSPRSSLTTAFHTMGGLLLPSHITVVADDPLLHMEDPAASDATGIDFLDDDRAVGARRYFEDIASPNKAVRTCKKCGEEGHDVRDCTTLICLTCNARNEHGTRSCPVLRVCFTCQGKGHLAKDCPRIGSIDRQGRSHQDCDRCGSYKHHGSNCPTLWRIYTYVTDGERDTILENRESKRGLDFGSGGEGYIARDHWCYNCSGSGHLGDDCSAAGNADKPDEHSAFGKFNWLTGPFASVTSSAPHVERAPRLWESGDRFDDGRGFSIEGNVGRRGREKARQRAAEAQKRLEAEDDEPDWFSRNREGPSQKSRIPNSSRRSQPTYRFGSEKSGGSRLSLLDRVDVGGGQRSRSHRRGSSQDRERGGDKNKNRDKGHDRDRDDSRYHERDRHDGRYRDRYEAGRDRGSHWRGGYDPW